MSDPKKETVRITLPPRPSASPGGAPVIKKETVRINLPARPILRTTSPEVDAAAKEETNRVPAVPPPTLTPRPFLAPPAPAGLRPPKSTVSPRPPLTPSFSAPAVPRPPGGSTPVVPTPPRPPGALPTTAPLAPAGVGVPPPSGAALGVPFAPRPPIFTNKAPPPAVPVLPAVGLAFPAADDDVIMPAPAVPVFRPPGLKREAARVDAPPVPRSGPAPPDRVDRSPPFANVSATSLTPTYMPAAPTVTDAGDLVPPTGDALPFWAYVAVFALALLTFGVQLAAHLAPAAEP